LKANEEEEEEEEEEEGGTFLEVRRMMG